MGVKEKKALRYIGYVLRDAFRFMPVVLPVYMTVRLFSTVCSVLNPVLIAEVFEVVGDKGVIDETLFWRDIILLCIVIGLPGLLGMVDQLCSVFIECGKENFYGKKMFAYARSIKLEAMEDSATLDAFQKAEEAYTNYQAMAYLLVRLLMIVQGAVTCVGVICVTGSFSLWLLPAALIGFIPHFALTFSVNKKTLAVYRKQTKARRRLAYLWRQFCRKDSVKEMRTMGFGAYLKEKWVETNVQVVREMEEVELSAARLSMVGAVIKNACYALNVAVALILMIRGDIAVGQFAACISAFATLQGNLLNLENSLMDAFEVYHRVEEYYDFFAIEQEEDGSALYRPFESGITLTDVRFCYRGSDTDALRGVNLSIKKGEHIVIVGVNGSGKTTLSKVLSGAYLPASGSVRYDGQELKDLKRDSLYRDISVVSQDFVHYNFTLRENIGISDIALLRDDARMNRIAESVGLEKLVQAMGGLDVQLGREFEGYELSGGEWQKVALARGLFKDSGLIILDEPTSALDPLAEYEILTKFTELVQDRTSVIISHRVGICRGADKVVVMKDGRVAECGTHEELLAAGGEYARIWDEQAKWY